MLRKKAAYAAMSMLLVVSGWMPAISQENSGLPPAVLGEVTGSKDKAQPKPEEKKETPATTETNPSTVSTAAPVIKPERSEEPPRTEGPPVLKKETPRPAVAQPVQAKRPVVLFGRIEEISGKAEPTFPIELKALTPKMDTRPLLRGQASAGTLAGSVVNSYPADFRGVWGGTLTLMQMQIDPISWQIDPNEANQLRRLFSPGNTGTVNFSFDTDGRGTVTVEPAKVTFMVPYQNTNAASDVNQMLSQQGGGMGSGAMAGMMQQMMGNMKVPLVMSFGNVQTSALMTGISGNQFNSAVFSNRIKQLAPGVMEQQIISSSNNRIKTTGRTYATYDEDVIRFTQRGQNQMYVEIAAVKYSANRQFERKTVLAGYITRGAVQQEATNPYAGLQQMFGGQGMPYAQPGAGGGNPLQGNPLFDPNNNPFKSLFGQ